MAKFLKNRKIRGGVGGWGRQGCFLLFLFGLEMDWVHADSMQMYVCPSQKTNKSINPSHCTHTGRPEDPPAGTPYGYHSMNMARAAAPSTAATAVNFQNLSSFSKSAAQRGVDDSSCDVGESCWVTVYGIPPDERELALRVLRSCGEIVQYGTYGQEFANFFHVKFSSMLEVRRPVFTLKYLASSSSYPAYTVAFMKSSVLTWVYGRKCSPMTLHLPPFLFYIQTHNE